MPLSRTLWIVMGALVLSACADSGSPPQERPTLTVIPSPAQTSVPTAPASGTAPVAPTAPAQEAVRPNSNTDANSAQTPAPNARYAPTPGMPQMAFDALKLTAYGMCKSRALGPDHPASALSQKLATVMSGNVDKANALMQGQLRTIAADRLQCKTSDTACQQQAQEQAAQILADMSAKKQQGGASEDV